METVKNVCRCGICGGPIDRTGCFFQCRDNPGHLSTEWGGFFDCTRPSGTKMKEKKINRIRVWFDIEYDDEITVQEMYRIVTEGMENTTNGDEHINVIRHGCG